MSEPLYELPEAFTPEDAAQEWEDDRTRIGRDDVPEPYVDIRIPYCWDDWDKWDDWDDWDDAEPERGPEVRIPGIFLEMHAAAPQAAPEAVRTLLHGVENLLQGRSPHARIEVPESLLGPLADYADERCTTWHHGGADTSAVQAANALARHVRGHQRHAGRQAEETAAAAAKANAPRCPEGDDRVCPTATCGCPPF
ncbi:hypothetical protein [Streptomyces sp. NPDC001933]|uniref:hypothetical protein n=1 Tax=Streptomyces sp. NPDC001933 TaxID=3364626 RepID=UPI0036B363A4